MYTQIRMYTINRGMMDTFVKAWKTGVVPLREQAGFTVGGAWVVRETNQFVWILNYTGPKSWEAANEDYYGSPGRKALQPDPASMIARMETHMVEEA